MKIARDLRGGSGASSGQVNAGSIASLSIGGSLVGGTAELTGALFSMGDIGPVKIAGNLEGGTIRGTAASLDGSGFIRGSRIASVFVGGSIFGGLFTSTGGNLTNNASIRAVNDIGAITIKGGIVGTLTEDGRGRPAITARGQETLAPGAITDLAIKSLTVGGRVERAIILAGFGLNDPESVGSNGNASIGPVRVGGDWIATSMTAGVQDVGADGFGNNNDARIAGATLVSRIASIAIKGVVAGSADSGDHFGFTAAQIGAFRSAGFAAKLAFDSNGLPDVIELSRVTGDVTMREVIPL